MRGVRGDKFTKEVMNTLLRDGELSFTYDLGNGETSNLEKMLKEKKARAMQKMDRELSKEFKQVYVNRPVYKIPR
jgi:uncharacterized protein YbjQ (UPF0145 family)